MKKALCLLLVFIAVFVLFFGLRRKSLQNTRIIPYTLNKKNYRLLTAKNPFEWERGLMYYHKLDGADGMIFLFPDKKIRTFWNKNTFIDLDLYWLNNNIIIGKSFLPSIDKSKEIVIVSSPDKANAVIELVAGK